MEYFTENVSKKTSTRQGRPRTITRELAENPSTTTEGCLRTKMNWVYHLCLIEAIRKAPEASQQQIWGCLGKDIEAGRQEFPKGFRGAAESAGRWIEAGGDPVKAVDIVADARERGISFGDIAKHFRGLRIGEREGNAVSLTVALARTLDEYQKRFPKTTDDQRIGAVQSLLSILNERE